MRLSVASLFGLLESMSFPRCLMFASVKFGVFYYLDQFLYYFLSLGVTGQ